MNEPKAITYTDFILPTSMVSKADVSRLVSEVERIDNELIALAVRAKTTPGQYAQPALSGQLVEFLTQNKLTLIDSHERSELVRQLRLLKDNLPVIHMTFAVVADGESLQQIAQWLRTNIHPQASISTGLQPALVAGVYMRTPNHVYDLSVRSKLEGRRSLLVKELGAFRGSN